MTLLLEFFFICQLFYIIWAPTMYSMLEKDFKAHITCVWILLVLYSFFLNKQKLFRYKYAKLIIQMEVGPFIFSQK